MPHITLAMISARVKRDRTKCHKSEKQLLNLALLCVIHSVAELFLSKFLLHIENVLPTFEKYHFTDIGFCVFISLQ